ncbi:unnamed protein product [Ambrosiozyma monospora]|uniref:Unnamed protein product n=1 Tax=Ambrosiozyma monospora TaxID=43982 RepID=A0A9W6Z1P9_AMBMO|nr:unnamed protein product [Ambrosiozyma monospora]
MTTPTSNDTAEKDKEIAKLKEQLQEKTQESEKYQSNYQSLLSRLSSMKTIFHKMKVAETELEVVKQDLLSKDLKIETLTSEITNLNNECDKLTRDNYELKSSLSNKEDEGDAELSRYMAINRKLTNELKTLKNEREEYVIMANEEQKLKQGLSHEINELNMKMSSITLENDDYKSQNQNLTDQIAQLNGKMDELIKDHSSEIHDLQAQIESKVSTIADLQSKIDQLDATIKKNANKLAKLSSLEQELKQKQLLVGKLRHENIVLNEHLTKAMKLIKKESSSETVDRELVSNLFISFLQIPRADTKKFEVLSLISNFLNWDDEKKRHAGLMSANSAKTRSNSVLNVPHLNDRNSRTNSFVSLWTEFLEKESTAPAGGAPATTSTKDTFGQ